MSPQRARHPDPQGDHAGRHPRHGRRQGHPHRRGRQELARGRGGARHGRSLRGGLRRHRHQRARQDRRREGRPARQVTVKQGDWVSINGATGDVYQGQAATQDPDPNSPVFAKFMKMADKFRGNFGVRANADIPRDAKAARRFGAEGIGLCRTEHMFFAEDRLPHMQAMILSDTRKGPPQGPGQAAAHAAQGFRRPVRSHGRLPGGDPHPRSAAARIRAQARRADGRPRQAAQRRHQDQEGDGGALQELRARREEPQDRADRPAASASNQLHEFNPMLGLRGCRLGIIYPEITEMQARAIFEAVVQVAKKGKKVVPEVMIPLIGSVQEAGEPEGHRQARGRGSSRQRPA